MSFALNEPLSPAVRRWVLADLADQRRRDLNRRMREAFASQPDSEAATDLGAVADEHLYPAPGSVWEHEDEGHYTSAEEVAEISEEDRAFAFSANGEFMAMSRERTGATVDDVKVAQMRRASAELSAMSHAIAEKMRAAGFDAYRDTPFDLYRYFVHSGHVEKLPKFRRVTFIPSVAQQVRAPLVSALESHLEKQPFARMWTLTAGARTPLCDVRQRAKQLHRKISTLNAQPFMHEAGVEISFRSTELGTPEFNSAGPCEGGNIERDADGRLFFHLHAHCVVILKRGFIPPKKWANLLKKVSSFWVHWWKDGGETENGSATSGLIVSAREVCKYLTKPGEMLKLTGEELCELQRQLSRLKLCQPLGVLAEEMKAREAANLRLVRKQTPEGPVFAEVKNWNRRPRKTKEEASAEAAEKLGNAETKGDSLRVVSRLLPGIGPCGVAEPRVIILAMNWDEAAVRNDASVRQLVEFTRGEFAAGAAIRVHTCTPTVLQTPAFPFVEHLPPPRSLLSGADLAGLTR